MTAISIGSATGAYRRRIRLVALGPEAVWGGLEDDFHHFEVTLRHDGRHVTALLTRTIRRTVVATVRVLRPE